MVESFSEKPLIYQQFSDIDHLAEVFRGSNRGSSYSMKPLSKNPFTGSLMTFSVPGITIHKLLWNGLVNVVGNKPVECLSFGTLFQVKGSQPLAHTVPINENCLFAFGEREANFITSSEQLQVVLVVIEKDVFWNLASKFGYFELDEPFFQKRNAITFNRRELVSYQEYLRQLIYVSETQPQVLYNPIMGKLIRGDFPPLLLNALQGTAIGKNPRLKRRVEIVKTAQEFMQANLHRPITLEELCQALYTSKRSLIYGFQEIFAMGPMSYLKIQRLNGIRRALLLADPKFNKVKNIAYDWGFWHLGHFSTDYKKMFGETPLKTLRSNF